MNRKNIFKKLFLTFIALIMSVGVFVSNPMVKTVLAEEAPEIISAQDRKNNFNSDWKFSLQSGFTDAKAENFDDSAWQKLNLPHDWSIFFDFSSSSPAQNEGGLLNGGTGWYRKQFILNENSKDKRVRVRFGGVYMNSTVYVNGKEVGNYPNGYTPFSYDITDFLHEAGKENTISVKVINQQPSSRWYSGSGIYRDVSLSFTDETFIPEYGNYFTTPGLKSEIGGDVIVKAETQVSANNKLVQVQYHLQDINHNNIETFDVSEAILVDGTITLKNEFSVNNPTLWDINNPKMYSIQTDVLVDGVVVDTTHDRFGFRFMDWKPDTGFSLNGNDMKFHGVSMHHDQGALGAVANYNAIYRQMRILKDMGVNAVRVTHNPADDKLIEIAEDMGLLIVDEAFDTWYGGKKPYDYGRFFEKPATHPDAKPGQTWAEFDLKSMVSRGKNSPAIIMWSVGNEIGESNSGNEKAVTTVKNLNKWVKDIDPTRYTTIGQDAFRFSAEGGHEKIAAELDAVGFNYAEGAYKKIRDKHPTWLLYGAETASATTSRGVYAFPDELRSHDNGVNRNFQQSDYGNDRVGWGKTATEAWIPDRDNQGYAGQFIWTGFDYIGEPTPWHNQNNTPPKSSYFGIVDTAGLPKNSYFLYQSQWLSAETDPMVHILPHWNWESEELLDFNMRTKDGKIPMRVYSNAHSVELQLNGQSLGEKTFVQKTTNYGKKYQEGAKSSELYLEWRLDFTPGELIAIAKDKNGKEIARDVVSTSKGSNAVVLTPEKRVIKSDGNDLSYIEVSVVDELGVINPNAQNNIRFNIEGDGVIVGVDNGNAASRERYKAQHDGSWQRKVFNGKAIVIVQSTTAEGKFTLTAQGDDLNDHSVNVYTADSIGGEGILGYDDVYVTSDVGIAPVLPETVIAVLESGEIKEVSVSWNDIDEALYAKGGNFIVQGNVENSDIKVRAFVNIREVDKVLNAYVATALNTLPKLPSDLTLVYTNGNEVQVPVVWDAMSVDQFKVKGIVKVNGTVTHLGNEYPVIAHVSVLEAEKLPQNIAVAKIPGAFPKVSATYTPSGSDKISNINDGVIAFGNRWTNWTSSGNAAKETEMVTIEFEKAEMIQSLGLHIFTDGLTKAPREILVSTSLDGITYTPVVNQSKSTGFVVTSVDPENAIDFDDVEAKFVRLTLKAQPNGSNFSPVGLSELKVYGEVLKLNPDSEAVLNSLSFGDKVIALENDRYQYSLDVEFEERDLELKALAKDGVGIEYINPSKDNKYMGKVIVTSQDGTNRKTYSVKIRVMDPKLESVKLTLSSNSGKQDSEITYSVEGILQDGSTAQSGYVKYEWFMTPAKGIKVSENVLQLYEVGVYDLKVVATYFGQTLESNTITVNVEKNEAVKTITKVLDTTVSTSLNKKPELPSTVEVEFDQGFNRDLKVTWNEINKEDYAKYGMFEVLGTVEGTDIKAKASVIVEGIVSVEKFSTATPLNKMPKLPETAKAYKSDNSVDSYVIHWDELDVESLQSEGNFTLEGTLEGTNTQTSITIRVSADTKDGENIAKMWTGSDLPAGIASYTNDGSDSSDRINLINDTVISYNSSPANRWTNWTRTGRAGDWVGILFADAGTMSKRYVDNFNIGFFKDSGTDKPDTYTIEYFSPEEAPALPSNFGHILRETDNALNNDANWKPVTNMKSSDLVHNTMNKMTFDGVDTFAIRIKMNSGAIKGLAVTEVEVYDRIVSLHNDFEAQIKVNGVLDETINLNEKENTLKLRTHGLPEIEVVSSNNASSTQILDVLDHKTIKILVKSEDGLKSLETTIRLDYTVADALQKLEKVMEEAKAIDAKVFTDESILELKEALNSAQAVYLNEVSTLEEINNSTSALQMAINALVKIDQEKVEALKELQVLINQALAIDQSQYTEITVNALKDALKDATEKDSKSTLESIQMAYMKLNTAIEDLEEIKTEIPEDFSKAFIKALEKARNVKKETFTDSSLVAFNEALAEAEALYAIMETGNETVSDKALIDSTKALMDAMSQLVEKDVEVPVDPTDPADPADPADPTDPTDPTDPLPPTGVITDVSGFIFASSLITLGSYFLLRKKKRVHSPKI